MSKLSEALDELKKRGLLDRASYLKVGSVEVQLGPPLVADLPEHTDEITRDDEQAALRDAMYGAARGMVPGVG